MNAETELLNRTLAECYSILTAPVVAPLSIEDRVAAVLAAYDRAIKDPECKVPTYLHFTIEALRRD